MNKPRHADSTCDPRFQDLELEIPGGDGEKTLKDALHGIILWPKWYIIIPENEAANPPRDPPHPPPSSSPGPSSQLGSSSYHARSPSEPQAPQVQPPSPPHPFNSGGASDDDDRPQAPPEQPPSPPQAPLEQPPATKQAPKRSRAQSSKTMQPPKKKEPAKKKSEPIKRKLAWERTYEETDAIS